MVNHHSEYARKRPLQLGRCKYVALMKGLRYVRSGIRVSLYQGHELTATLLVDTQAHKKALVINVLTLRVKASIKKNCNYLPRMRGGAPPCG